MSKNFFIFTSLLCLYSNHGQSAVLCPSGFEKVQSCSWAVQQDDQYSGIEVLALCQSKGIYEYVYDHIVSGESYTLREEVSLMKDDPDFPGCKFYENASSKHAITFCKNDEFNSSYFTLDQSLGMSAVFICK
jgi:hypothetical protein